MGTFPPKPSSTSQIWCARASWKAGKKEKSHISNIDDDQEVGGGGGGGGGGTFGRSIEWGCPSCAVPEFE